MDKKLVLNLIGKDLYDIFKKYNVILAGGTIRSLYCSTLENKEYTEFNNVNDLDIYFTDMHLEGTDGLKNISVDLIELSFSSPKNFNTISLWVFPVKILPSI